MSTSSNLRWTACFLACASSLVVFNSSTVTRRPRSARRSIVRLLIDSCFEFSAPGPALPHAELEHGQIGGAQQPARRHHHFSRSYRGALREREQVLARL